MHTGKKLTVFLLLAAAVGLYIWAARQQGGRVNTDMHRTDQKAYMNYAKNLARTNFQFIGGRNRMPAYPALMALFYRSGMTDAAFFERGKQVGIGLGLIGLVVVFWVLSRVAGPVDALAGTLVAMFTLFVYKTPYFQAEILYYTIGFILFYFLVALVKTPGFTTAVFSGLAAGAGFLTKASVLPAVVLAAAVLLAGGLADLAGRTEPGNGRWFGGYRFFCAAVLGVIFLTVIFPYIQNSRERFGTYFYNVNTTFYMWYDSWEEVKKGTRAHGDRQGWPDLPPDQIPSFRKYVDTHSLPEMVSRLSSGIVTVGKRARPYTDILLVYGFLVLLLAGQNRAVLQQSFCRRKYLAVFLFISGYFISYVLLYAWYVPIASGSRFVLTLYLPALFICVRFAGYARERGLCYFFSGRKISAAVISPVILILLSLYLLAFLPDKITSLYGGG